MIECPLCSYSVVNEKAVFCPNCGTPILASAEQSRVSDRLKLWGGELRMLSVFFVNFIGFEKLISTKSPKEVITKIREYFTEVENIINEYKGTANQIIPDSRILGIFGAPKAHADDPIRVIRCAWRIRNWWQNKRKSGEFPEGIDITIGINTGRAFFGYILEKFSFLTVIGDTINTAARLTEICPLNEIVISGSTYDKTAEYIKADHIGERSVKGKTTKINVYLVKKVEKESQTIFSQKFPICGREKELKKLIDLSNSIKENKERFCVISGQMGIGKTRLKEEFEKYLAQDDSFAFLETHCSVEIQTPYYPFKFLLKKYLNINEFDGNETVAEKLDNAVSEGKLSRFDVRGLNHLFSTDLRRLKQDEIESVNEEIYTAVRNLLKNECRGKALVLIFEEFNRADEMSKYLVAYLTSELKDCPVMFLMVNVSREFLTNIECPIDEINLTPLSLSEVRNLVRYILGDVDEKVVDFIYRSAGGNPLFTIEAIRNTRRTKLIKKVAGQWVLEKEQRLSFLDDLYGVVMSTIDSLPSDYRLLIDYASVIGYSFSLRILKGLFDNVDLVNQLHYLVEEGYIVLSKNDRDPVYVFRHNLLKDAAYTVLPLRKRKEIHQLVATLFEKLYADQLSDFYENIGHHYLVCENYKKAAEYHKLAGDKAKNLYAIEQALNFYNVVLKINKDTDGRIGSDLMNDLLLNFTDIYEITGDVQKMSKTAQQGLELSRKSRDVVREINFMERYAYALLLDARFDKAEELLLSAVDRCDDKMVDILAVLYSDLALLYQNRYEYEKSIINYNLSWNTARDNEIKKAEISCLYNLSQLHRILGNYEQALDYLNYGLEELIPKQDLRWQVRFKYLVAAINTQLWNLSVVEKLLLESFETAEDIGNTEVALKSALDLAAVKALNRQREEAEKYLEYADKKLTFLIRENLLAEINLKKAVVYYRLEDYQKTHDFIRNALVNAQKFAQKEIEFYCYIILSLLDEEERVDNARKALEIAETIKAPPLIASALYRLTRVFLEEDDLEKARYYGRKALFVYDDIKFKLNDEHRKIFSESPEYKSLLEI
ncbi:MAG TPA: hypothetical protein ENI34_08745 [candidate division WOR-3 bacterium]|uniref:Guanylate cyclase domain-containing protein n=1 Tax=candidate division WOR-3 bacterium TaxID=2052148 RepID=A0A9C9K0N8_UNCW3|nr:hypothetical protein [candidate division WOR-3 bacterium]